MNGIGILAMVRVLGISKSKAILNPAQFRDRALALAGNGAQNWHVACILLRHVRAREPLTSCWRCLNPSTWRRAARTDRNPAYSPRIPIGKHETGKHGTRKIERKRLSRYTWSYRRTCKSIRFSKRRDTHGIAVALVINSGFYAGPWLDQKTSTII